MNRVLCLAGLIVILDALGVYAQSGAVEFSGSGSINLNTRIPGILDGDSCFDNVNERKPSAQVQCDTRLSFSGLPDNFVSAAGEIFLHTATAESPGMRIATLTASAKAKTEIQNPDHLTLSGSSDVSVSFSFSFHIGEGETFAINLSFQAQPETHALVEAILRQDSTNVIGQVDTGGLGGRVDPNLDNLPGGGSDPGTYRLTGTIRVQSTRSASGELPPEGPSEATFNLSVGVAVFSAEQEQEFVWQNPPSGDYADANNWEPVSGAPPRHDENRSDIARFVPLPSQVPILLAGGATAGRWVVQGAQIDFRGSGELFVDNAATPSLQIESGGMLRLSNGGNLVSRQTTVGPQGPAVSTLEVLDSSSFSNTGQLHAGGGQLLINGPSSQIGTSRLTLGTGGGEGLARVTEGRLHALNDAVIGDASPGTVEVFGGGRFEASQATLESVVIGRSAMGTVRVRGEFSVFRGEKALFVGGGSDARIIVEDEGLVNFSTISIPGPNISSGSGEVQLIGPGAGLWAHETVFVRASAPVELEARAGFIQAKEMVIGLGTIQPGASADVTLRGAANLPPSSPQLLIRKEGGCCGEPLLVGVTAPGQLSILEGATAELDGGGMVVGSGNQGILLISGRNAPAGRLTQLLSKGLIEVGKGGRGIVQLDSGLIINEGEFKIGFGEGTPSGSVTLENGSDLRALGNLTVGEAGQGLLTMSLSALGCHTLQVGGATASASGTITVGDFSILGVGGNALVGTQAGVGQVILTDPSATLIIDGTLTIGNGGAGPGAGTVVLMGASLSGKGNVVVTQNGSLTGTGTVNTPKLSTGGFISPGLSPGTLSIEGDFEQLSTGVLLIEVAGLSPGEFDVLRVSGQATLGGTLEVRFIGGVLPKQGDTVEFLTAGGLISGSFAQISFPQLAPGFAAELNASTDGKLRLTALSDAVLLPQNPDAPRFVQIETAAGQLTLHWSSVSGRRYRLEATDTLTQPVWTPVGEPLLAASDALSATIEVTGNSRQFYRIAETEN